MPAKLEGRGSEEHHVQWKLWHICTKLKSVTSHNMVILIICRCSCTDVNSDLNNATISKWIIISTYLRIYCIQTKTNYIKLSVIELSVILTVNRTGFSQNQITSNTFSKKCELLCYSVTFMTHEGFCRLLQNLLNLTDTYSTAASDFHNA